MTHRQICYLLHRWWLVRQEGGRWWKGRIHRDSLLSVVCFLRALNSNRVMGGGSRAYLLFSEWGFSLFLSSSSCSLACYLSTYKYAFTNWKDLLLYITMDYSGDFLLYAFFHYLKNFTIIIIIFYNQKSYKYSHWKNKTLKNQEKISLNIENVSLLNLQVFFVFDFRNWWIILMGFLIFIYPFILTFLN